MAIMIYLLLSLLVGFLGIGLRGGFFLYFILSIALSPLVGLMILVIVGSNGDRNTTVKLPRY
ncbi:MAG TPA: hypothetical protein PLK13_01705 [Xanthobacteraceae bacterium]|jgi:hypothetical protein|uniref:hypothetical protein n=1 Tax=Roseixanthobacter TaxID=3462307 RepID=UPI000BC64A9F|nr:MAG: hypothetical protein B7Y95_16020 [Rhizobiales bacterium 32-66-11]OZB05008.1 MAG: hypothetical protein B7X67_12945 [Rhizobiales bacterium 39-66-18]HQS07514.1 hypothetical protein [Xanthobacteraceae bacterium]